MAWNLYVLMVNCIYLFIRLENINLQRNGMTKPIHIPLKNVKMEVLNFLVINRGMNGRSIVSMNFDELYKIAKSVVNPRRLSEYADAGGVGAAILAKSGNVYTGVCIDTACSMGFCAEHAAAAAMITAGESHVLKMIAVGWDGHIMPPCGRCREFISQIHKENLDAEVMVKDGVTVTIRELLPYDWRE
jgi:cytidine deaminase